MLSHATSLPTPRYYVTIENKEDAHEDVPSTNSWFTRTYNTVDYHGSSVAETGVSVDQGNGLITLEKGTYHIYAFAFGGGGCGRCMAWWYNQSASTGEKRGDVQYANTSGTLSVKSEVNHSMTISSQTTFILLQKVADDVKSWTGGVDNGNLTSLPNAHCGVYIEVLK